MDLLLSDPKYEISRVMLQANETMETLMAENRNFNFSLNSFIDKTDRQWQSLDAGAYPLEQIMLWSACGLNFILVLVLIVYIIKLHILVAQVKSNGGNSQGDDGQRIFNIMSRVMELESQLQFGDSTVAKSSTPKEGAPPFKF
jgi:hypothetical protein